MSRERNKAWPVAVCLAAAVSLVGCSGNGIDSGSTISSSVPQTVTPVLLTDAPADAVLSLSLTLDSIVLTDSAGKTTTVLSKPVTVEASHLDAVQEPLLPPLSIPQDTYVSATFTAASPTVVYVDPTTGKPVTVSATLASATDVVTFTTPITVSATSTPIAIDLLVGQSVAISGTTVTVTPTFNVVQIPLAAAPTNGGNGKITGALGQVGSVSGSTLALNLANGQTLSLTTNSSTVLQGITTLSQLTAGELVDVDYAQQSSGSLLALRVHLISSTAETLFGGPVTAVAGSPLSSFSQLVRQPLGPGATPTSTGTTYTVDVGSATTYGLAAQAGTLPSLPFTPAFSATTLFAGQNVLVAASSVSGTTVTAASVTLAPQTVDGTVSAIATVSGLTAYTITLPASSALATLAGTSSVTVYVGTSTQTMNASTIAVGGAVRFNGLLFKNGSTPGDGGRRKLRCAASTASATSVEALDRDGGVASAAPFSSMLDEAGWKGRVLELTA